MTYLRFQNSFVQIRILWLIIDYFDLFMNEYNKHFPLKKSGKEMSSVKLKVPGLLYKSIKRKNKLFKLFVTQPNEENFN